MKRVLSILLALLVALTCMAFAEPESNALPALGDTLEGFVVTDIVDFQLIGAELVLFEHERTGAQLLYIANEDTNRVFELVFRTEAVDNTGLPHVFEHATLDGSEKYPSKALFFNLSYQTYNTYMNASTSPKMTSYPIASLSEAQLLKYADYYTDSCLHPMVLEDESIFREEAWRYRLESEDDPLTIEGTVYSEMLGASTLEMSAYFNAMRTALPGSYLGNSHGGQPEDIPGMTWDDLKAYHDLYYHPSNCTAYLYGQFEDYTAFLRLLDEAFQPYERLEFTHEDPGYEAIAEPVQAEFAYPTEASSDPDNASGIYYMFVCPGLKDDPQEELVLNTLTDLLITDASPMAQAIKKALPSASFSTYIETSGPDDMIVFNVDNVNREDAEIFAETVDAALLKVSEAGFSQDMVDSVMASLEISTKLIGESSELGLNIIHNLAYDYSNSGDIFGYVKYVDALSKMDAWNQQGLYRDAVRKWLVDSQTTALSTTYPEPGLREELDAQEAERLNAIKAAMSEEELSAILASSNAQEEAEDVSALIASLQAVTIEDLPEEIRTYEISDETDAAGLRSVNVVADVDGIGATAVFLDAEGLEQSELHWLSLYTALIGQMDTAEHTQEELSVLMERYLYGASIYMSVLGTYESETAHPYLRFGWTGMDDEMQAGYDLIYELLYQTDFSDVERLSGLISNEKASLKSSITSSPLSPLLTYAFGRYTPVYRLVAYARYFAYYSFLEDVEREIAEHPEAVQDALLKLQADLHNRSGALSAYAGSEDGVTANAEALSSFLNRLDDTAIEPKAYDLPMPSGSVALIVDSNVAYNGLVIDWAGLGLEGFTGDQDAYAALVSDTYLLPMLRDQYGAYGAGDYFTQNVGLYAYTYRDPNILKTYQVFSDMPKALSELEITQETLNGYIMSSYSEYALPTGELTGALSAAIATLNGEDPYENLTYMRELKSFTAERAQEYAGLFERLAEDGISFTAAGARQIAEVEDLFVEILNPFGSVDSSEIQFEDVGEGDLHYEAVRYAYEEGLMLPIDEATFGAEETATAGDLFSALYALIGGPLDQPEEAVAFFAEYGLTAGDGAADAELTGADAESALAGFSALVELPFEAQGAADEAITRGELAEILMAYTEGLE